MTLPITPSLIDALAAHSSFLLVTHVEPDGDGIGSCLALWHWLQSRGRRARVWLPQGVPPRYAFLPGAGQIVTQSGPEPVTIALDCDGPQRLGEARATVEQAEVLIDIDHHQGSEAFGHLTWVDPSSPAVGHQVYRLLESFESTLTREIATCLYCAIGTDSGYFRYANTTPDLLRAAAELVAAGADPKRIAEATLDRYDLPFMRLAGLALSSVSLQLDGTTALAVVTAADYARAGTTQTEGLIDFLRSVAGADLLVLIRESPQGWRVSLRSLGAVDVGAVARQLGGGGHAAAAGCTLAGDAAAAWAALEPGLTAARREAGRGQA